MRMLSTSYAHAMPCYAHGTCYIQLGQRLYLPPPRRPRALPDAPRVAGAVRVALAGRRAGERAGAVATRGEVGRAARLLGDVGRVERLLVLRARFAGETAGAVPRRLADGLRGRPAPALVARRGRGREPERERERGRSGDAGVPGMCGGYKCAAGGLYGVLAEYANAAA